MRLCDTHSVEYVSDIDSHYNVPLRLRLGKLCLTVTVASTCPYFWACDVQFYALPVEGSPHFRHDSWDLGEQEVALLPRSVLELS